MPFNSFKSAIGPAKSALVPKIASSMHEFREFADTDVVFERVHLSPPKIAERTNRMPKNWSRRVGDDVSLDEVELIRI